MAEAKLHFDFAIGAAYLRFYEAKIAVFSIQANAPFLFRRRVLHIYTLFVQHISYKNVQYLGKVLIFAAVYVCPNSP